MKKLIMFLLLLPLFAKAITPIWTCGFECGVQGSVGQHWSASGSFSTSTVRSGARSARLNTSASIQEFSSTTFSASAILVTRFYIRFATLPATDMDIFRAAGGVKFKQSDSKLYASGSTFGATGVSVTTGVWYRIDVKNNVSANPWLIDVKVNGVDCGQASFALGSTTLSSIVFGQNSNNTADLFIDDILVSGTSGDYPIGAGYVNHFVPTSDDTHNVAGSNDFERTLTGTDIINGTTTAYQLIDDVPLESGSSVDWINMVAPANATDYVACIFGPASGISTPTSAPRAVEILAGIHQAGTGTGNMVLQFSDGTNSSNFYDANVVPGTTSVIYKRGFFATRPGGGAWTSGSFNTTRIRFVASSGSVDANPDQYLDCVMIEAEFQEPPKPRRVTVIN